MKKALSVFFIFCLCPAAMAGVKGDLSKGSRLYKEQKFGQALTSYQKALSQDPYNQEALFNIGAAHYRLQEYKEAQEAWENASQKPGERKQDAQFNLGNAFYRAQDLDAAIAAYRKAILQNPQDKEAIHNLQIVLEQKEKNQQDSSNNNQNDKGDNNQNQNQNNQGGQDNQQDQQQQQQQQKQQNQANSSQMSKEEAQRVAQMAKENEYRPSYATPGGLEDSGIEKDW